MSREERLSATFVELADTLVTGFDVVDLVHTLTTRCVELTDVDAAGIMLADEDGSLHVIGSSSERIRLLELLELQISDGPCLDSYRTGEIVYADLLATDQWPTVREGAIEAGYRSVVAVPMRLRTSSIGALNLFRSRREAPTEADIALCRALADVATIGLLQERTIRESRLLADQLQSALNTRVVVEQAKGILAERTSADMNAAFDSLRNHARRNNLRLGDVARDVISGRIRPDDL